MLTYFFIVKVLRSHDVNFEYSLIRSRSTLEVMRAYANSQKSCASICTITYKADSQRMPCILIRFTVSEINKKKYKKLKKCNL